MKKIFFFITLALMIGMSSCRINSHGENLDDLIDELSDLRENIIDEINESMDKKVVIINQTGDTVVNYYTDSVRTNANVNKLMAAVDKNIEALRLQEAKIELAQQKTVSRIVTVAIFFPCLAIVLIVVAVLIFLLKRYRTRSAIIEKAIENGYDLPDSFFSGNPASHVTYNYTVVTSEDKKAQTDSAGNGEAENVPPIPNIPPFPESPRVKDDFRKSMIWCGVGIVIIFFFLVAGAPEAAVICGGIPLLIGGARLATFFYFKGNR